MQAERQIPPHRLDQGEATPFAREEPRSLASVAYDIIERQMIRGDIAPGALLSEVSLSQRISIGRTPVREALQRLVRDRLVRIIPRKGAVVAQVDVTVHLKALEMRREVERCIAGAAARSASLRQRRELDALAAAMREALAGADIDRALEADRRFKLVVLDACDNAFLTAAVRPLHALARRFYFAQARRPDAQVARTHASLMQQIARGDAAAAESASDAFIDAIAHLAARVQKHGRNRPPRPEQTDGLVADDDAGERASLSARAYELIESRIVTGRFQPGEILTEGQLSRELSIGRTPVREALQRLASHHLVTILPRRGALIEEFDQYDLSRLVEARRPLESLLSRLAARRASTAQRSELAGIANAWTAAAQANDTPALIALDQRMKALVIKAADDVFLADAIAPIHGLARRLYFQHQHVADIDVARAQVELLEAIVAGDETEAAFGAIRFIAETARAIRQATAQRY
jgi:DNA-binding GntR family transcriptional regulator